MSVRAFCSRVGSVACANREPPCLFCTIRVDDVGLVGVTNSGVTVAVATEVVADMAAKLSSAAEALTVAGEDAETSDMARRLGDAADILRGLIDR